MLNNFSPTDWILLGAVCAAIFTASFVIQYASRALIDRTGERHIHEILDDLHKH